MTTIGPPKRLVILAPTGFGNHLGPVTGPGVVVAGLVTQLAMVGWSSLVFMDAPTAARTTLASAATGTSTRVRILKPTSGWRRIPVRAAYVAEICAEVARTDAVLLNAPPRLIELPVLVASKIARRRLVLLLHGGLFNESTDTRQRRRSLALLKVVYRVFDAVVTVSDWLASVARSHLPGANIVTIHNALDASPGLGPTRIRRMSGEILFMGRLEHIKGPDVAIRALAEIAGREPRAKLIVAGHGSELQKLQDLATELRNPGSTSNLKGMSIKPASGDFSNAPPSSSCRRVPRRCRWWFLRRGALAVPSLPHPSGDWRRSFEMVRRVVLSRPMTLRLWRRPLWK